MGEQAGEEGVESGGGLPAGTATAEPTGEPTPALTGEPTPPPAPAGEPALGGEPAVETAPEPAAFPSHEEFNFTEWDGADVEAFPEELQPWLRDALARVSTNQKGALEQVQTETDRWKRMFEATSSGEDDPRIAEADGRTAAAQSKYDDLNIAFNALNERVEKVVAEQTDRYVKWFANTHPDVVKDDARFEGMATLSEELDVNWDVALEIQNLGSQAVEYAQARKKEGKDIDDTLELMKLKYTGEAPQPKKDVETSQALASNTTKPPPVRSAPPEGTSPDLNTNIRNVVRAALAKKGRGSKRPR